MTNLEMIKSMSTKELGSFLEHVFNEGMMHQEIIMQGLDEDCDYILGSNPYTADWLESTAIN